MSGWHGRTSRATRGVRVHRSLASLALGSVLFLLRGPADAQAPQPPASVPLPAGATAWQLIFEDNFDSTTYNTANWNPYADWGGNGSFNAGREKYYPSQIRLADGICHLVAEPNEGATTFVDSYHSGELISARQRPVAGTPYKFSFLYGYIEARIKIVNVFGFFGAFWMLPCKENYTYEWEIDILEVLGHDHRTMFQTYHYAPGLLPDVSRNTSWTPNRGTGNNGSAPVLDYSTGYHTFGVDWQPDHLTFYIDGYVSGTFPNPGANNENIPRTPGYVLIQHMVENSWIRATGFLVPDTSTSVDTFHIDYVRVWQGVGVSAVGSGLRGRSSGTRTVVQLVGSTGPALVRLAVRPPASGPLAIFNSLGRVVGNVSAHAADRAVVWDASRAPPGVYAVTARAR